MAVHRKREALYVSLCVAFWLGAMVSPSDVTQHLFRYDYLHLYNHLFYCFLAVIGLASGIATASTVKRRIILSLAAGAASSYLALVVIVLIRQGAAPFLGPSIAAVGMHLLILLAFTFLFFAPIWAVAIGIIHFKMAQMEPSSK